MLASIKNILKIHCTFFTTRRIEVRSRGIWRQLRRSGTKAQPSFWSPKEEANSWMS